MVRMFDKIFMASVFKVVEVLDAEIVGVFLNKVVLLDLMRLDCDMFNYFSYYDISLDKHPGMSSIFNKIFDIVLYLFYRFEEVFSAEARCTDGW